MRKPTIGARNWRIGRVSRFGLNCVLDMRDAMLRPVGGNRNCQFSQMSLSGHVLILSKMRFLAVSSCGTVIFMIWGLFAAIGCAQDLAHGRI